MLQSIRLKHHQEGMEEGRGESKRSADKKFEGRIWQSAMKRAFAYPFFRRGEGENVGYEARKEEDDVAQRV